ncbi:hypothetical protein D3C76_598980 [compost metagenome]
MSTGECVAGRQRRFQLLVTAMHGLDIGLDQAFEPGTGGRRQRRQPDGQPGGNGGTAALFQTMRQSQKPGRVHRDLQCGQGCLSQLCQFIFAC